MGSLTEDHAAGLDQTHTLLESTASHVPPHIDKSDVDSSSEEESAIATLGNPAGRPTPLRYLSSDSSKSLYADAPQGPTNTSYQTITAQRNPQPRSFTPNHRHPPRASNPAASSTDSTVIGESVTICVDGQEFSTTRNTLTKESSYFRTLLHNQGPSGKQPDVKYFIDADLTVFQDILQYLRRGLLPVYWDRQKGHDHLRYAALLAEAQYFQIDRLTRWLAQKDYLKAVKQHVCAKVYNGLAPLGLVENADVEWVAVQCFRRVEKVERKPGPVRVYVCPRGIPVHRSPNDCGKACDRMRGKAPHKYVEKPAQLEGKEPRYVETPVYDTLVISKTVTFDSSLCTAER